MRAIRLKEYIDGWTCAAGIHAIAAGRDNDPDFMRGWYDGKKARRSMEKDASERYDAPINIVQIATLTKQPAEPSK